MGFVAAAIAISGAASAGASIYNSQQQSKAAKAQNDAINKQIQSSTSVNSAADAEDQAKARARAAAITRSQGYSQTILTSGQGDTSKANTGKTLLGQ